MTKADAEPDFRTVRTETAPAVRDLRSLCLRCRALERDVAEGA